MNEQKTVALIYVRVSRLDEEERERKLSPSMQRERALALPDLKGLTTEVFEDLDISGKATTNRPGYMALMERLERGDVRYVVAYDLSRTMRNLGDQQDFFEALQRRGAQFIDASKGRAIDVSDEDEELMANIEGSVNQHARKKTARRVRDTLSTKVARGELVGPPPAGYLRRKDILPSGRVARTWVEPDPEKAPIIQLLYKEYATGNYSLKTLAMELNRRGVPLSRPAHFNNGRPAAILWTADVLKDILANPRYVGRVPRRDGQVFVGAYPALVDENTWNECERIRLRGRSVRLHATAHRPSVYLLSGVLRCALCGSTMSGERRPPDRSHAERRSYTCYRRRVASACTLPYLTQAQLEIEMIEVLRAIAVPDGVAEAVDAALAAQLREETQLGRSETVRQIQDRQARLNEMYELGRVTREDYASKSAMLDEELRARRTKRSQPAVIRQRTMVRSLVDKWEIMTIDERRHLIGLIFEEVTAGPDGITNLRPQADWKSYMRAVVPVFVEGGTERKTGLVRINPPFALGLLSDETIGLRRAA